MWGLVSQWFEITRASDPPVNLGCIKLLCCSCFPYETIFERLLTPSQTDRPKTFLRRGTANWASGPSTVRGKGRPPLLPLRLSLVKGHHLFSKLEHNAIISFPEPLLLVFRKMSPDSRNLQSYIQPETAVIPTGMGTRIDAGLPPQGSTGRLAQRSAGCGHRP